MALHSVTDFAKLAGVSRNAIYGAIRTGRVTQRQDGRIDDRPKGNRAFIDLHKVDRLPAKKKTPRSKGSKKSKPGRRKSIKPKPVDYESPFENTGDLFEADVRDIKNWSDANLRKTIEQIRKYAIQADAARGQLIDRTLVRGLLGTLSQIDVNELLTMGANIAPELAGMCGTEEPNIIIKITKRIEELCYQLLAHRQRVIRDFLKQVKVEVLENGKTKDHDKT